MRRSNVVVLVLALIVGITATGVVLSRRGGDDPRPNASASPTATPAATVTASPTVTASASPTARPTPTGPGPRNRQYDVVYARGVSADAGAAAVAALNGEVIHENAKVGVATVRANPGFVAAAMRDRRIHGVYTNRAVGRPPAIDEDRASERGQGVDRANLADLQWDMSAINVPEAHRRTKGDKRVIVAVLDTGVDGKHPDLAAAFDRELSRNFVTDYPGADGPCEVRTCVDPNDVDGDGHGTHVAGTIAAADDGRGITGVAPGVRLVNLRTGQDAGLFFLMATVDALVYAGDIGVDVANMSYYLDPWLFNCPDAANDSAEERYEQRAAIEGVRRAVDYAYAKGVTLVAAAGNEGLDLTNPRVDDTSPNFPDDTAKVRAVDNDCLVLPSELPHVIQVSAVGRDDVLTSYSNWGRGQIAVTAPGGSRVANGQDSTQNLVLSTYPESLARGEDAIRTDGTSRSPGLASSCVRGTCAYYRWFNGTSMAAPHVTGVAALIVSMFGTDDPAHPGTLRMDPAAVEKRLRDTARALACPRTRQCQGTRESNGFYGNGLVDADAATRR
ncbi:MAG TPA: S8 family serine peptidase [Frankiaceae bacterium]|jgi:subtilisin family serine protease|nr:S8 family serine peptidase [Frankiaceae bacterium]